MNQEQRDFIFRHPWYLKLFPVDERVKIILSYTKEEQLNMIARYDLELKYCKFKKNKSCISHI